MAKIITEAAIQRALIQHIQLRKAHDVYWVASANGIRSNPIAMRNAKLMGVRPGTPDLHFLKDGKAFYLELKTAIGRPSPNQLLHKAEIEAAGGTVALARGLDEALKTLEDWHIFGPKLGVGTKSNLVTV